MPQLLHPRVGQMPLEVDIRDAEGSLLRQVSR